MNCQLKLEIEKDIFVYDYENDFDEIIQKFKVANALQIPVLSANKNVIGLINIFDFIKSKSVFDLMNVNFIAIEKIADFENYKHIAQDIFPIVTSSKKYVGFARKSVLENYIGFEKLKHDIDDELKNELKFHMDLHNELNTILELSSDGIFITDGSGNVLRMNSACEKLDGVDKESIIGKNVDELVKLGIYSESVALKVLERKDRVTVLQNVKDGREVISTGTPVFNDGNNIDRVIVNVRDVTELNNLKNELIKANDMSEKITSELEMLRMQQLNTGDIVLDSPAMKKIVQLALKVAKVDSTVLIEGESGVGKGFLSKFIHNNSNRKDGPFIKIECSSIPENLLESELFGYEKGAFTGAEKTGKIGLVELANGGTLFLDEIGEISMNMQVKLLRLIQDREFIKIGGKTHIPVDIRIITATNKDLKALVAEKKFREDLFYRLNVIPICIPPLRERKQALGPLILKNIGKFNEKYEMSKGIDAAALKILVEYNWPGNVRELENAVEMLVVTSKGNKIDVEDLPANITEYNEGILINYGDSFKNNMDVYEKKLLVNMMKKFKSTQEMSKVLKIDASTLRRKFKKHNIEIDY